MIHENLKCLVRNDVKLLRRKLKMVLSDNVFYSKHLYVLDGVGVQTEKSFNKVYTNRADAEKEMHRLVGKYSTRIVEQYDDNHDKTYVCENGAIFYIQRMA